MLGREPVQARLPVPADLVRERLLAGRPDAAARPGSAAHRVLGDPDAGARLEQWVRHYFGDTAPGAATERFHGAIRQLMEEWDSWYGRSVEEDDEAEEAELDDAEEA